MLNKLKTLHKLTIIKNLTLKNINGQRIYISHKSNFCDGVKVLPEFKILFFGNDEISLPSIANIYEDMFKEVPIIKTLCVITTRLENKKSTQAFFHRFLEEKNIDRVELRTKTKEDLDESWKEIVKTIQEKRFNLGVVASFGKMIPESVIKALDHGVIVMHPSLLPKYRGAAPIQTALLNNELKTGISLIEASVRKFDAGKIIMQKEIEMEKFYRFKELSRILAQLGSDSIIEYLYNFDKLNLKKIPQDESLVTKAKLITDGNEVYLDFTKQTSEEIIRTYRAYFGSQLEPFTKILIDNKERLLFFDNLFHVTMLSDVYVSTIKDIDGKAKPGCIFWDLKKDRNNIVIKTANGWLVSNKIKLDCTGYEMGEKMIMKIFMNHRYKDKANTNFANVTVSLEDYISKKINN